MENKKVFIGNLDFSATEAELTSLLSKFGTVTSLNLKQKKGCAFFEMESVEDAARSVQQLNGTKFKGREIRLSFYMKARKARIVSTRTYKERGVRFAEQKSDTANSPEKQRMIEKPPYPGRPVRDGGRPGSTRSPKPDSGYKPRERSSRSGPRPAKPYSVDRAGPARPVKKPWSAEKPLYPGRPVRDGGRPGSTRSPKPDSGYKPRERSGGSGPRPASPYPSDRFGTQRPAKRPWSADNPSSPGRPTRGGERSGFTRPAQREGVSPRPSRPTSKTGLNRGDRPGIKKTCSDTPRDYSKPRSPSGSQKRFSKSAQMDAVRRRSPTASPRPTPRGNSAAHNKPQKKN